MFGSLLVDRCVDLSRWVNMTCEKIGWERHTSCFFSSTLSPAISFVADARSVRLALLSLATAKRPVSFEIYRFQAVGRLPLLASLEPDDTTPWADSPT